MAFHRGQLLKRAAYIPNSRGGIAAGCRQFLATVVEGEIQNLVLVSPQGGHARIHPRVPYLRGFIHRRRRDQRTIEIVEAVGQLRAMPDQYARTSDRRLKIYFYFYN